MVAITRQMLEHAEHVRKYYLEHQAKLRRLMRAGARVESGSDMLLNRAVLDAEIPSFAIDLSKFSPEWLSQMRLLLRYTEGGRRKRLRRYRTNLSELKIFTDSTVTVHLSDIGDADLWESLEAFFKHTVRLQSAVWRLHVAGWMYAAHLPQAPSLASEALEVIADYLASLRPVAVVIPIR